MIRRAVVRLGVRSGAIALVVTASLAVLLLGNSSIAGAHNSLDSSVPESGATLTVAPTVVELNFKKDVPLESFSSALTSPDGTRTPLAGAIGGQAKQVNVRLPNLTAGEYSLRWKLVSSDGHAITDTVQFNVQGAPSTTAAPQTAPPATNGANLDGGLNTPGVSGASGVTGTSAAATPSGASGVHDANTQPATDLVNPAAVGGFTMPGPVGWGLRALGYGLFAVLVGGLLTGARLWPQRWSEPTSGRSDTASRKVRSTDSGTANLKLVTGYAAAALAAVAALAALVSAGDIVGQPPWAAIDDLWRTSGYGQVKGAIGRGIASAVLAVSLLKPARSGENRGRGVDELLAGAGLAAIALSFSISGHPASLGAPVVGVPLDMIHLVAASAWMGSMVFLGPLAPHHDHDRGSLDSWRSAVLQFGALARNCVIAIVITGTLQSIRIDGAPHALVTSAHGRLTLAKILLLSLILWAANINRQRISRRLERHDVTAGIQGALRRAMATELTIGGFVMAITAALVAVAPAG